MPSQEQIEATRARIAQLGDVDTPVPGALPVLAAGTFPGREPAPVLLVPLDRDPGAIDALAWQGARLTEVHIEGDDQGEHLVISVTPDQDRSQPEVTAPPPVRLALSFADDYTTIDALAHAGECFVADASTYGTGTGKLEARRIEFGPELHADLMDYLRRPSETVPVGTSLIDTLGDRPVEGDVHLPATAAPRHDPFGTGAPDLTVRSVGPGAPASGPEHWWAGELAAGEIPAEIDRAARSARRELAIWAGLRTGDPQRRPLGPVDVRWVRGRWARNYTEPLQAMLDQLHVHGVHERALGAYTTAMAGGLDIARALLDATPFLLDPGTGHDLLGSVPPGAQVFDDLRLPAPLVLVLLGAGFRLDARSGWWDADWAASYAEDLAATAGAPGGASRLPPTAELFRSGGTLYGMLLAADEHGHLRDEVGWVLDVNDEPVVISGDRRRAELAPFVASLAAAVTWGRWQTPERNEGDSVLDRLDDAKSVKSAMRKQARKAAARDAEHGVHVISPKARWSGGDEEAGSGDGQGRTPAPHFRVGHFRRSRIATRDESGAVVGDVSGAVDVDWHYEWRWITPGMVGRRKRDPDTLVLYRIPGPVPDDLVAEIRRIDGTDQS